MPTKAELQATVNSLVLQLKAAKENIKHYSDLAQERHKQIQHLSAMVAKQVDDDTLETKTETIERLNEKLNSMQTKLQEYVNKNHQLKQGHPTDVEVKMRNQMRQEIKDLKAKLDFVQDEHDAVVKKNEELLETCKALGDQINTANGVAPTTRPAQAESIVTPPQKIWQRGHIHPIKGPVPKVPEGYKLAQPDEDLYFGAIVHNATHNDWARVHFESEEMSKVQPSQRHWYANPKSRLFIPGVKSDWGNNPQPMITEPQFTKEEVEFAQEQLKPWDMLDANKVVNKMYEQRQETPEPLEDRQKFATGAVRSSDAAGVRYDLITPVGLRRLAETYKEGSVKYGDNNWQKGFPASDVMNHAIRHVMLWLDGDKTEDHLAHAAWNLLTIMHFEERKPECIDVPTRK